VIESGKTEPDARQITITPDINEYFLSAAPDGKSLLVCDSITKLFYTVNTSDGSVTQITDIAPTFYPLLYSPDGASIAGNSNQYNSYDESGCNQREFTEGVASFIGQGTTNALSNIRSLNNSLVALEDWAPSLPTAVTPPITVIAQPPVVAVKAVLSANTSAPIVITKQSEALASTGIYTKHILVLAILVCISAGLIANPRLVKKTIK
jgi:hypothetical protein